MRQSAMGGGDEMWQDFERADLADFMRSNCAEEPILDVTLPEYLGFSREQRAFIASRISHVVESLTYELSFKWSKHMLDILVAGEWDVSTDDEPTGASEERDTPS